MPGSDAMPGTITPRVCPRISVICDAGTGSIVGYVTLSAAQIEREFLAKAHQRNKPDPVPATLLGQLGIYKTYQGQGHARFFCSH